MTKVLFILSAVIIAVSGFFAWNNGREFANVRSSVTVINMEVQKALNEVNSGVSKVSQANAEIAKVRGELDIESEKVKSQKLKLAQVDNDLRRDQDAFDAASKKLADLKVRLDKLPQGMKPETMVEEINSMKKATAETEAATELKRKEKLAEQEKLPAARRAYEEVVKKIEDRKKAFDRNSLVSRIVAVNNAWGFVVVDAGQNRGINEATKLLVTRGNQIVGKLSIVSVEKERTVANIQFETLANGMSIAPGDRVILENLTQ